MKKSTLLALTCLALLLTSCSSTKNNSKNLSNEQILTFYEAIFKMQMPDAQLSINKREKLSGGFESVELVIKMQNKESSEILFVKDDYIFPDVIDVINQKSFREELEIKRYQDAKINFEKNAKIALQNETQIIALGDGTKPKIYVFSDPECPFCRQHLANIEEELKDYQINFVLTSVHGESAFKKVAQIYKEAKNAQNDKAKIAILRKYYNEKAPTPKVDKKAFDEAIALYEKYTQLGLRSVPVFVEAE